MIFTATSSLINKLRGFFLKSDGLIFDTILFAEGFVSSVKNLNA